ncbi:MAG TPA: hypothetical protein VF587_08180, partial [Solirubrobacteraceae bacterium]
MRFTTTLCLAVLGAGVAAAPAAADGSLSFVKDGNVFVSAPDGSGAKQLTTDGGYESPSQADDGTVVAARQTQEGERTPRRLHRMDRDGQLLNPPVVTVPVDNSYYIGPLQPKVSPDGRYVAYHYFYTGPLTDDALPTTSISYSDRDTVNGEITSTLGDYMNPSWLQDGRLAVWYAAERTYHADLYNPDGSVTNWFGDSEVSPLLLDGEVSADGSRLAALGNDSLRLYEIPGGPANAPQFRCAIADGSIKEPTWSPDGRQLAYEAPDGIHVVALDDLGSCSSAARTLVVPGGADPDWGPAAPPSAPKGPEGPSGPGGPDGPQQPTQPTNPTQPGAALAIVRAPKTMRAGALRRGLKLTVRCQAACAITARLASGATTLASGRGRGAAGQDA